MRVQLLILAVGLAAQPALAQWGLWGFTADGRVYEIDEFTGDIALVGDIGVSVVDAADDYHYYTPQEVVVLTDDDRIVSVNLRNLETTFLAQVTGRPTGYTPVAFSGDWAVLRSPEGDDILYQIDGPGATYKELGPTGLGDVSGMGYHQLCTTSGGVYDFDWATGQASLKWSVGDVDPLDAITETDCWQVVTGEGMYGFRSGMQQPVQVRSTGLTDITALAYSSAFLYACDYSTSTLVVCDVFDFLAFQNDFVNGVSKACDCDTSTGTGVCDIFDFLCFQSAWGELARVWYGCQ